MKKKPSQSLTELKQKVTEALQEKGFSLESFYIEIEDEDDNHTGHLRIRILPNTLKDETEIKMDEEFNNIIKGFGL